MTPHHILWNLPLALGRQLEGMWWRLYFDRTGGVGIEIKPLHRFSAGPKVDRVTG